MPTRLDLRASLRRRLEDTSATPLWDDDTLNELLADAVRQYGIRFPAERSATLPVEAGDTVIPVDPAGQATAIVLVRDPTGRTVPRSPVDASAGVPVRQSWMFWDGALSLSVPAVAGDWHIAYLGRRELVDNDVDQADIRAGDEEIVILLAASGALLRRAVELSKRGVETAALTLTKVAERHGRDAEVLMEARRRRATGGWFSV